MLSHFENTEGAYQSRYLAASGHKPKDNPRFVVTNIKGEP